MSSFDDKKDKVLRIDIPSRIDEAPRQYSERISPITIVKEERKFEKDNHILGQYPELYPYRTQNTEDLSPTTLKEKISGTDEIYPPDDYPMSMWTKLFRYFKSRANKLFNSLTGRVTSLEERVDNLETFHDDEGGVIDVSSIFDAISEVDQKVSLAQSNANIANATASSAYTKAESAQATADAALPKAGGEMTGNINFQHEFPASEIPDAISSKMIRFHGTDNGEISILRSLVGTSGKRQLQLASLWSGLESTVCSIIENGICYATAPHPRDNYGTDIVTTKALKDYAARKTSGVINIFIGGAGASDTADLYVGRGESADKPFASFIAAFNYANSLFSGGNINFILQADLEWNTDTRLYCANQYKIKSDSSKRTFILKIPLIVADGIFELEQIKLQNSVSISAFLEARGNRGVPIISFNDGVEIDGNVSSATCVANFAGIIMCNYQVAGSVTGKKYESTNGGKIIGVSKLPGTAAGMVDANSNAFG